MLIYFQVHDRLLRTFLNDLMPRLPFGASAGETPPGLTDKLIFYDPLVAPTRPGHILPAKLQSQLESGQTADAEKTLTGFILECLVAATVEHDSEMEVLAVESDEHRRRLKEIDARRARLSELAEQFAAASAGLKDWISRPAGSVAGDPVEGIDASPDAPVAAVPESTEPHSLYAQLGTRLRTLMDQTGGMLDPQSFDDAFRLAFDMGLSPETPSKEAGPHLEEFRRGISQVMHMSEFLARKFSEIYQLPQIRETETALAAIRSAVQDIKARLTKLQQKRSEALYSAGLNLAPELDRQIQMQIQYFHLDTKRRVQPLTVEEKKQFGLVEEELQKIARTIDSRFYVRFASSPDLLSALGRLNQAIIQTIQELIRAQQDEPPKADLLSKLTESYHGASPLERWLKMDEQVKRIMQFSKLLSGRARNRPFSAVTPPPWPVTKSKVRGALDHIQTLDTTVFPEKFLRRRGPPSVLLLPCFGSGLYDWRDGLLVVSLYPDDLNSAVLSALAEFRLDADDSKELFNSYAGDLKKNRGVGFVRLKETFIADYRTWIQKEAAGYRVMEKDVRLWFDRKIPLGRNGPPSK